MLRRRAILSAKSEELYPIGTDTIKEYIRSVPNGFEPGNINTTTGKFNSGGSNYASQIYVPILPQYRFSKNGNRILCFAWYDRNKEFISSFARNNLSEEDLPAPPSNAYFFRIGTSNKANMNDIKITRIS